MYLWNTAQVCRSNMSGAYGSLVAYYFLFFHGFLGAIIYALSIKAILHFCSPADPLKSIKSGLTTSRTAPLNSSTPKAEPVRPRYTDSMVRIVLYHRGKLTLYICTVTPDNFLFATTMQTNRSSGNQIQYRSLTMAIKWFAFDSHCQMLVLSLGFQLKSISRNQ